MKHVSLLLLIVATAAFAAPPTPITATDVPDTITLTTPAATKEGIASAYNAAVLEQYNALAPAQQATYTAPPVLAYMRSRLQDVYQSYKAELDRKELTASAVADKWSTLTTTQKNQIKAILGTP